MLRAHRTTVAPSLANSFAAPAPIPVPVSMCYYRCYCRDKEDVCDLSSVVYLFDVIVIEEKSYLHQ